MDTHFYITQLRKNRSIFEDIFRSAGQSMQRWKKDDSSWSFLEVLCHLLDEEREDFRLRLQSLWNDPNEDFIPIDPANWPQQRKYLEQDFNSVLEDFLNERSNSCAYLEELDPSDPRWNNSKMHEHLGKLTPSFYLLNWLAHDLLHIRQLTRIRYDYLISISDIEIDYAGNWK